MSTKNKKTKKQNTSSINFIRILVTLGILASIAANLLFIHYSGTVSMAGFFGPDTARYYDDSMVDTTSKALAYISFLVSVGFFSLAAVFAMVRSLVNSK